MNHYRVDWLPEALDELAEIFLQLRSRSISRAVEVIDGHLQGTPDSAGTLLSEGLFRITEPPLIVYYSILTLDHRVEVSSVIRVTDLLRPS